MSPRITSVRIAPAGDGLISFDIETQGFAIGFCVERQHAQEISQELNAAIEQEIDHVADHQD